MTTTDKKIDTILDELATVDTIEQQVKIMSGENLSVLGHATVNHTFGEIDSFTTYITDDIIDHEITLILDGHKQDFSLDQDVLYVISIQDHDIFLLPVQEGLSTATLAVIKVGGAAFDPAELEKMVKKNILMEKDTHQGFDTGKVNNLVKMVNSGEDIGDVVEGLDNDETDDEVLSFRGF